MDNTTSQSHSSSEQFNGEGFVEELRNELQEIDAMEVSDHAQRFEALHKNSIKPCHQLMASN